MYGLIWKILPGPAWLRVIWVLAILAGIVYALFTWGYPWVAENYIRSNPNIG